jgi:hypothetical protein
MKTYDIKVFDKDTNYLLNHYKNKTTNQCYQFFIFNAGEYKVIVIDNETGNEYTEKEYDKHRKEVICNALRIGQEWINIT